MSRIINTMSLNIVCVLLLLAFHGLADHNETHPSIYGVRWFLGSHFAYSLTDNTDNNEYFVLMFNSNAELDGELNVLIERNRFSCTHQLLSTKQWGTHHHEQQEQLNLTQGYVEEVVDEAVLYKCVIGNIRAISNQMNLNVVDYSIVLDNLYISQSLNANINNYSHITLFSGVFRLPYYQQSFQAIAVGDWGQIREAGLKRGYVDILPCLLDTIKKNKDIIMIMFTGDMAYDLQGLKYYSMLKYIQPITSQMVFVATPGNHDTFYHADTFVIFTKSFYTPQWRDYFNYFNKIKLGNLLFVSYNPQVQIYSPKKVDRLNTNLSSIFQKQFTPQIIKDIRSKYFPIVFSHYPIYCSQIYLGVDQCQNHEQKLKVYREYFNKIDMKLYISGHLHLYQRTKPICFNKTVLPQTSTDMSCPIYIIEGAGGNNAYLQMEYQYPIKNYSSKIVSNSGFGLLTVKSNSEYSYPQSVRFEHISAKKCEVADHFRMHNPRIKSQGQNVPSSENKSILKLVAVKSIIFVLLIVAVGFLVQFIRRTYKRKNTLIKTTVETNNNGHVEMVEQNFEAPHSDKNEQNRTS